MLVRRNPPPCRSVAVGVLLFCTLILSACASNTITAPQPKLLKRSYRVCPAELAQDALSTLKLEGMPTLRLSDLVDEAHRHGFTVMNATYGRLPSKQCEDLLSMDPATPVIRIHVPTASGSETHRSFVVVSHDGEVTHIEARYSFEPPSPSVIDHVLKALGLT